MVTNVANPETAHEQEPTVQFPTKAATAHYAAHLANLHSRLADVSAWADSARKAALIEEYTQQISEYETMIEVGAELAEAADDAEIIEEEDAQAVELERAYALASVRQGWTVSYSAKLLMLTLWHTNGAHLDIAAQLPAGWLVVSDHNTIIARNRYIADGELCVTMIEEMRGLEALKPSIRPLLILADAFPY